MSAELKVLSDEVRRILAIVEELYGRLTEFHAGLAQSGRSEAAASHTALLLENSYTALETMFLRISQHFENSLDERKRHSDLLDKMVLRVSGIRERVIEDDTRRLLDELRRFRHFCRYYFEMEFDWNKLDYLVGVHRRAMPLVRRDIGRFLEFLAKLGRNCRWADRDPRVVADRDQTERSIGMTPAKKYNTHMRKEFDVIVERDREWFFIASVLALPGCHSQAKSLDELQEGIRETILLCLDEYGNQVDSPEFVAIQRVAVDA